MDSTTLSSEKSTFFNFPCFITIFISILSILFPLLLDESSSRDVIWRANILVCFLVEFATLGRTADGKVYHHLWTAPEITDLLRKHGLAKEEKSEEK